MKSKILATILAAMMLFTLAACGSNASTPAAEAPAATEPAATDTASAPEEAVAQEPAASAKTVKVGMVTDIGGVHDGSFNQSSWEGLERAGKDFGIDVKYLESHADSDYLPNIETFIDEEYDLIICVGYMLAEATRQMAEANPDQQFAIIDDASMADLPNVTSLVFEAAQASYLAGYAAGMETKTNVIGFVVGMNFDTMNEFGYGYLAGALYANPDVKILQNNVNSFGDPAGGKTAANNMIANKADVIYHAAGGTGLGVIDACKEAKIKAIGVDTDQLSLAPDTILTSALKRVDTACYDSAKQALNGSLSGGVKKFTLADSGVDIAPITNSDKADEITAELERVKGLIIDGSIKVPNNKQMFEEVFDAQYGDIYELD